MPRVTQLVSGGVPARPSNPRRSGTGCCFPPHPVAPGHPELSLVRARPPFSHQPRVRGEEGWRELRDQLRFTTTTEKQLEAFVTLRVSKNHHLNV